MRKNKQNWIKLFSIDGPETPEQMEARVRTVCPESLRQARVRFDLVAMLAFRSFLQAVIFVNVYLHVYITFCMRVCLFIMKAICILYTLLDTLLDSLSYIVDSSIYPMRFHYIP